MSPYEIRLQTEAFRRVGLFAPIKSGHELTVAELTALPPADAVRQRWHETGLSNIGLHALKTTAGTVLFIYLESTAQSAEAAAKIITADPWFRFLSDHLQPHPRAAADCDWMPMETINIIGPTCPLPANPATIQRIGVATQLKPSAELTYRTLHQTNWPGVVDQMTRSNRRYWVTFLIELGPELWLFTYTEYVGADRGADDAAMSVDPVTQRWWQHAQPCLKPISKEPGGWTTMQSLME